MTLYKQTEKECADKCLNKVCLRCGRPLSPIETVDNADNPTFWSGCMECMIFSSGTSPEIYANAKEIKNDYNNISMDDLCRIIERIKS